METQSIHHLAIEICRTLKQEGYQAFIVGGCVRDLLLGNTPKDWDITTNASPEKVMKIFPKTIPTGLQHGTVTVVMGEGVENHFEVTTFRVEGKYKDGRRPEEVFFVQDIKEDLSRRDLTINAMAFDPINNELIDPYGGQEDIKKGIIQTVGDPAARFQEDGLRIMRAARFAARFGYHISLTTLEGMHANLETLKKVSKERISDELSKTLMSRYPAIGLHVLQETGALDIACPLLAGRQLPLLEQQDACSGELETRLAFMYNRLDITKVEKELLALKFSGKEIKKTIFLLKLWDRYLITELRQHLNGAVAYRHFIAFIKNEAPEAWEHALEQFVILTKALEKPIDSLLSEHRGQIVFSKKEMQINGNDLLEIGIKPGPQIKQLLDSCYLEIIQMPTNNSRHYLLRFVQKSL